ncbi:MAG: hypothetical protein ACP5I1_13880 [Candidatus Hinthialibacter sp.]
MLNETTSIGLDFFRIHDNGLENTIYRCRLFLIGCKDFEEERLAARRRKRIFSAKRVCPSSLSSWGIEFFENTRLQESRRFFQGVSLKYHPKNRMRDILPKRVRYWRDAAQRWKAEVFVSANLADTSSKALRIFPPIGFDMILIFETL